MNAGAKRRGDDAGKDNNARSAPKRRTQASAAAPRQSGAAAPLTALGVASAPHGRIRIVIPPARRQAHTSCGRQGRRDASPRGSAEFSASRHSLEQRRGAAAEEFLKSRVSSIPYRNNSVVSSRRPKHLFLPRAVPRNVPRPATFWRAPRSGRGGVLASPQHPVQKNSVVSSRRPKHLFYTALTSSRRAATRARSTNFAKASRPRKNLPSLSHNHFGERRGAGSESFGTDTCGTDASGAVALFSAAP